MFVCIWTKLEKKLYYKREYKNLIKYCLVVKVVLFVEISVRRGSMLGVVSIVCGSRGWEGEVGEFSLCWGLLSLGFGLNI